MKIIMEIESDKLSRSLCTKNEWHVLFTRLSNACRGIITKDALKLKNVTIFVGFSEVRYYESKTNE